MRHATEFTRQLVCKDAEAWHLGVRVFALGIVPVFFSFLLVSVAPRVGIFVVIIIVVFELFEWRTRKFELKAHCEIIKHAHGFVGTAALVRLVDNKQIPLGIENPFVFSLKLAVFATFDVGK